MGKQCFICKGKTDTTYRMHAEPKNSSMRKKWRDACAVEDAYTCSISVCSKHFRDRDYKPKDLRYLREDAVPTLHLCPTDLSPKIELVEPDIVTLSPPQPVHEELSQSPLDGFTPKVFALTADMDIKSDIVTESYALQERPQYSQTAFTPKNIAVKPEMDSDSDIVTESYALQERPQYSQTAFTPKNIAVKPEMDSDSDNEAVQISDQHLQRDTQHMPTINLDNDNDPVKFENERRFKDPRFATEVCLEDFATPSQATRALQLIMKTLQKKNKQIKNLQDNNRRLKKRLKALEELVEQLKNND